ncbi:Fatty acyl-CoA reductase 1-like protein [Drosera capensis]
MEIENINQFLDGKTFLVTGATGLIAKILIEKLLRVQPNLKKLYILVREKNGLSARERLKREKVVAVAGELACENLGVHDRVLREEMWREIEVVFHVAATTNFYERYDVAFNTNTMGVMHVVDFAKKSEKIRVLLHVSTGCLTLITTAKQYGWPHVYVFTKSMGEMLIGQLKGNLPVVILRPTIITSTYKEPIPGWIEGLRMMDPILVAYGKGTLNYCFCKGGCFIDLIPADMVVNSMIVAAIVHANQHPCLAVYQLGSSFRNPLTMKGLADLFFRYFSEKPLANNEGTVRVHRLVLLGNSLVFVFISWLFVLVIKVRSQTLSKQWELSAGYIFSLGSGAVSWVPKLQKVTALSTTEAEYMALVEACKKLIWLKGLWAEIDHKNIECKLHCDNQSVIHLAKNSAYHSCTRHIDGGTISSKIS